MSRLRTELSSLLMLLLSITFGTAMLSACSGVPSQEVVETAIAQTETARLASEPAEEPSPTALKSATATSTETPLPSKTPTGTATPTASLTPTSTATPSPTSTPTPDAPVVRFADVAPVRERAGEGYLRVATLLSDETAWVMGVTEDGEWYQVKPASDSDGGWVNSSHLEFVTDRSLSAVPVATNAPPATNTPTPTFTPTPTWTPTVTKTPDPRGEYEEIDVRELESYADDYIGDKVRIRGEVFNIEEDYFQIWVRKPGGSSFDTVAVIISWQDEGVVPSGIYNDTIITVYGIVGGTLEGTNAYGATIEQPVVFADIIEK